MKKIFAVLFAVFAFVALASAQPRALGVRVGWGGEISYQHTLGAENFLEVDAGWGANSVSIGAAYDFQIAPVGPFGFYAGPSAQVWMGGDNDFVLGVGAQVGLEYIFPSFPLQISLDWRPVFDLIPSTGFGWQSVGLGIRYAF
jgi:hypothetical protein